MQSLSEKDYLAMKSIDIKNVDKTTLVDLKNVQIDVSKPVQERVQCFLQQIQNPYCFRIGDVAVKVNYQTNGPSFQKNFEDVLRSMQK